MSATALFLRSSIRLFIAAVFVALLASCKTMETEPEETGWIDQPTFVLIDLDNDGKVSPAEMAKHQHREALAEFDLDNDKQISTAEWKAAKPSATANNDDFTRLDLNKDGKLNEEETVLSITSHIPYQEAFKKMDANADGYLHWEEYKKGDPASLNITLFSAVAVAPTAVAPAPAAQ